MSDKRGKKIIDDFLRDMQQVRKFLAEGKIARDGIYRPILMKLPVDPVAVRKKSAKPIKDAHP
jgi:hypothetical protein